MTTPPWCREKVMVYYYYKASVVITFNIKSNILSAERGRLAILERVKRNLNGQHVVREQRDEVIFVR